MDGNRLSELRQDMGLTQKQLADLLCVSIQTISSYERGRTAPDDATKVRLAHIFNVSVDYLLGETNVPNPQQVNSGFIFFFGMQESAQKETMEFVQYLAKKYKLTDSDE